MLCKPCQRAWCPTTVRLIERGEHAMSVSDGPRPSWIPGHARRHQRTGELDSRWMPACQCGWAFYASVRTLRIADRTHGFHLDRVHSGRHSAAS